jgi:monothiol glutaredoxin
LIEVSMSLSDALRTELDGLVRDNKVVLFMKGNKSFPQCGFSATVVGILGELVDEYETIDVLSRQDIRDGIKVYSDWPTIPQLYVDGEFLGGCDIVREMAGNGELHKALGVTIEDVDPPNITITDSAAAVFRDALADGAGTLRFRVSKSYQYDLAFDQKGGLDLVVTTNGIDLIVDRGSAKRADGTVIDYEKSAMGEGFRISNPNEPGKVRQLTPKILKGWLDEGKDLTLFDVRTGEERATATIGAAVHLDDAGKGVLAGLPKDAVIVLHCHHGMRSQQAAEDIVGQGFKNVFNLSGGIDAWSQTIDSSVPRY